MASLPEGHRLGGRFRKLLEGCVLRVRQAETHSLSWLITYFNALEPNGLSGEIWVVWDVLLNGQSISNVRVIAREARKRLGKIHDSVNVWNVGRAATLETKKHHNRASVKAPLAFHIGRSPDFPSAWVQSELPVIICAVWSVGHGFKIGRAHV